MAEFSWDLLAGPYGGTLAASFIAGFAGGWSAAMRIVVKEAEARIAILEKRVTHLEDQVKEANDRRIDDLKERINAGT